MSAITGKVAGVYKQYSGTDKSKEIANFQDAETWTAGAGATATDDAIVYRLGTESISLLDDDDTGGLNTLTQNSMTLNLEQFEDTSASDTVDYIMFIFNVVDTTYVTNVILSFSPDATYDDTDYYKYTITNLVNGWNYVKIKKSVFTSNGTPSWSAVQSIQVAYTSTANANTNSASVKFQSLYLLDVAKDYDFALVNNTAYTLEFLTLFYNWTADVTVDVEDTTAFLADGVTFKEFTPTLNSFTMSIEKFWANGDFLDSIQSDLILIAYTDTVNGYRHDGLAKITSDGITCEVGGIVNETLELQGSGELTYNEVQIIDA